VVRRAIMDLILDQLTGCARILSRAFVWHDDCYFSKPLPLDIGRKLGYPLFTEEKRMNDDMMPWPWNDTWIDIGGEA
jgi:hypothetical protein